MGAVGPRGWESARNFDGLSPFGFLEGSGPRGLAPGWMRARVDHPAGGMDKILFCEGDLDLCVGCLVFVLFLVTLLFEEGSLSFDIN